jgi:hypothetical protein
VRQSPINVRLGTDSVNPFRQQIYKSLVSVALKPHAAKPPANEKTGGFAFSPYAPASSAAQKGIVGAIEPEWQQQERRTSSPRTSLERGTPRSNKGSIHPPAFACSAFFGPWPVAQKEKALGTTWGTLPRAALGVCAWSRAIKSCTREVVRRLMRRALPDVCRAGL